jgi:hypothetical protein
MLRTHPDLESQLAAALHAKSEADERMLTALESLQARLSEGAALQDLCADLQGILSRVNAADPDLTQLQRQWAAAKTTAGEFLNFELARQQRLLQTLITCVHEIAAIAQADRDRLRPELDSTARARRMCAAYAAAGRHR